MSNVNLTVQDYDTLIEAVDSWISASKRDTLLTSVFMGSLLAKAGAIDEAKEMVEMMTSGEDEKVERRKETATLLKAKLIQLRDKAAVAEVSAELRKQGR